MSTKNANVSTACCGPDCCSDEDAARNEATASREIGDPADARAIVRQYYAERAITESSCCSPTGGSIEEFERLGAAIGYDLEAMRSVPDGANLGLGCGNPTAIDALRPGEIVLDLGSGGGFDCFLAARQVGPTGRVIGVDMTPEMIERARANASSGGYANVAFRLGEIENLPVETSSVDVVISNCVINLSTDKPRVFAEAFRVLKPGGRLMVSDLVLTRELPDFIRRSAEAYAGCIGGAEVRDRYLGLVSAAGFTDLTVTGEDDYLSAVSSDASEWIPDIFRAEAEAVLSGGAAVTSLKILARKPA